MTDFRENNNGNGNLNGAHSPIPTAASPVSINSARHHGFDFGNIVSTPQKSLPDRGPASPPPPSIEPPPTRSSTSNNTKENNNNNNNNANVNAMLSTGAADFFSPEVFQIVLHNPSTAHQLLKFSQARLSGENMEFLERVCSPVTYGLSHHERVVCADGCMARKQVDRYNTLLDELTKILSQIHSTYISPEAPKQLNLSHSMMKQMNTDIKMTNMTTLPAMELMFMDAQEHIENMLASDIYPRFVKHQMTTSAVQALGGNRAKYAGLGDCFCLTNPS